MTNDRLQKLLENAAEHKATMIPDDLLVAANDSEGLAILGPIGRCGFCGTMTSVFVNCNGQTKCTKCATIEGDVNAKAEAV